MSCDRNLTVEEWLEIVHGFWQVGRDRGFGPSGWISRLNVTITNVSKVFVCSMDSVPCFISMCWQDSDWISGAVVLEGLVDFILFQAWSWWPGSQLVSAAMVLEELVLTTVDSVPRSQGVDKISTVDHQELVNLVQMLFQCISYFAWVLCIRYLALCILCGFGPKPLG